MKKIKFTFCSIFFVIPCLFGCNKGDTPVTPTPVDFTISSEYIITAKGKSKYLEITLGEDVNPDDVNITWVAKDTSKIKGSPTTDGLRYNFETLEQTDETTEIQVYVSAKNESASELKTCFVDILEKVPTYTVTFKNIETYDEETGTATFKDYGKKYNVEWGSTISQPTEPSAPTYSGFFNFSGWYKDPNWSEAFDFNEAIKDDLILYASYTRNDEMVVAFKTIFDDGSIEPTYSYQKVKSGEKCSKPSNPKERGYSFDGWKLNDSEFDFNTPITTSILLEGKLKLQEYSIYYVLNGGVIPEGKSNPTSYNVKTEATALVTPERENYQFQCFVDNNNNELFSIGGGNIGDLVLTAKYDADVFNITYHGVDGLYNPNPTRYTCETKVTLQGVCKPNRFFDTWYTDEACTQPIKEIARGTVGDINLYASVKKADGREIVNYDGCGLEEFINGCKELENGTLTQDQFLNLFRRKDESKCSSLNGFVGSEKEILVNEQNHKIRIVGANHDVDENDKQIPFTFEFKNLLSDKHGNSIAYQWNDIVEDRDHKDTNKFYLDSSSRKILAGDGGFKGNVYASTKSSGTSWDPEYTYTSTNQKTVFSMLPEFVRNAIIPAKKITIVGDHKSETYNNRATSIDKVFILSRQEAHVISSAEGDTVGEIAEVKVYEFYNSASHSAKDNIKSQVNRSEKHTSTSTIPSNQGQVSKKDVVSYAGFNNDTGGRYWLRKPFVAKYNYYICSWAVEGDGNGSAEYPAVRALGIAPAFCI